MVFVSAYTRVRNGHAEHVSGYVRSQHLAQHERMSAQAGAEAGNVKDEAAVMPAQTFLLTPRVPLMFSRPPYEVPPPRTGAAPRYMERIPNQSGKEAAKDTPSWARGERRIVDEAPEAFARRVMDGRYGRGNWVGTRGRDAEYRQIKKFGQRGFRDPRSNLLEFDDQGA
jgi:hypothetical protein